MNRAPHEHGRDGSARRSIDGPSSEEADASRRTYLAAERTYLAWWRAGLAALAVALGVGRLLPDFTSGPRWPFVALGIGFAALGITFLGYGIVRERHVERSLAEGHWAPMSRGVLVVLAVLAALLAFGVLALVLAEA